MLKRNWKQRGLVVCCVGILACIGLFSHNSWHRELRFKDPERRQEISEYFNFTSKSEPDLDFEWELTQSLRKSTLREKCSAMANNSSFQPLSMKELFQENRRGLSNMVVDDKHKVIYCSIPKIASTQWKKTLLLLSIQNAEEATAVRNMTQKVHSLATKNLLSSSLFKKEGVLQRMATYKKFMFVRHPLERLLSAYRDKFETMTVRSKPFINAYAYNMMKAVRNSTHISRSGEGMKFEEFLAFLTTQNPKRLQEHWSPYVHLCHPCVIDYDYIGKYETLETDSNQILKRIKAPDGVTFPLFTPSKTTKELDFYLRNVSSQLYDKLFNVFRIDFELFGYEKNYT